MEAKMEPKEEKGLWKKIGKSVKKTLGDLKEDSVAANPTDPVDCCNPPEMPKTTTEHHKKQGKPDPG